MNTNIKQSYKEYSDLYQQIISEEKESTSESILPRHEATASILNRARLEIGKHEMNPFAGVSYGDCFLANGELYRLSISTEYGLTLRKDSDHTQTLQGFVNLPDYHSFVYAINMAAANGLPVSQSAI